MNRYWDLANRYAGFLFTLAAVFVLLPEGLASQLGLASIRTEYKPYGALVLILSGTVIAGSLVQQSWPSFRRRVVIPFMKLAFPVTDRKTPLKQSRMRYYQVRFTLREAKPRSAYMELDSNGKKVRYVDRQGKTFVPDPRCDETILSDEGFQFPSWGQLDWKDILDGSRESGCWGIGGFRPSDRRPR